MLADRAASWSDHFGLTAAKTRLTTYRSRSTKPRPTAARRRVENRSRHPEHKRLIEERSIATANEEAARREVLERRTAHQEGEAQREFVPQCTTPHPLNSIAGLPSSWPTLLRLAAAPISGVRRIMLPARRSLQMINDILDLPRSNGQDRLPPEEVTLAIVRGGGPSFRGAGEGKVRMRPRGSDARRPAHRSARSKGAVQLLERDQVHAEAGA